MKHIPTFKQLKESFYPNIAPGSTYAIEIQNLKDKVSLSQDNGQEVVIHVEDLDKVIKKLQKIYDRY